MRQNGKTLPEQMGITVGWELISKADAMEHLNSVYDYERSVRRHTVERYAQDMAAKRWPITHQGIAFDQNDRLIDGQHRLWAIVETGRAIWMLVVRNLPTEARAAMDQGAARTLRDITTLEWATGGAIAIARRMMTADTTSKPISTRQEEEAYMAAHENAIRYATKGMPEGDFKRAAFRAAVACAWYHEDVAILDDLKKALTQGHTDDRGRASALGKAIRYSAELHGKGGGGGARRDEFLRWQRIVQAFVHREPLSKVYVPSSMIYPVPTERNESASVRSTRKTHAEE